MQRFDGAGDREIGLAGTGRTDAEREVVHAHLVEILALVRSAAADAAALSVHHRFTAVRRLLRDRTREAELLHAEMHAVRREGFLRRQFVHPGEHLRGGKVARGGLRWSDRREDFRTEILGLVKAQQVKNTVIVPVGSKGGFVLKNAPPATDREAFMAEGIACYKLFLSGLLDITDNVVKGTVVPPKGKP